MIHFLIDSATLVTNIGGEITGSRTTLVIMRVRRNGTGYQKRVTGKTCKTNRYNSVGGFINVQNCQLCIPIYLQFPSLFATYDVSKYEN